MNRKAYIEVGSHCFASCTTCSAQKQYKFDNDRILTSVKIREILDQLIDNGFEEVRFTGLDPLTYLGFSDLMYEIRTFNINKVVNTTLLSPHAEDIECCTWIQELIVSLSGVKDDYQRFFGVKKFHILDQNLRYVLPRLQGRLTFNYTVYEDNCSLEHAFKLSNYLDTLPHKDKFSVMFFPAMGHNFDKFTRERIRKFKMHVVSELAICNIDSRFELGSDGKHVSMCDIHQQRLYIKKDGTVYGCCMGGGELGQKLYPELCLGDVWQDDICELIKLPPRQVNNPTCDHCTPKYYNLLLT